MLESHGTYEIKGKPEVFTCPVSGASGRESSNDKSDVSSLCVGNTFTNNGFAQFLPSTISIICISAFKHWVLQFWGSGR